MSRVRNLRDIARWKLGLALGLIGVGLTTWFINPFGFFSLRELDEKEGGVNRADSTSVSVHRPVTIENSDPLSKSSASERTVRSETTNSQHPLDPVLELAKSSLDKMQAEVRDYTATILKRERIQGKLGDESTVIAKIIDARPPSPELPGTKLHVYLRFESPKAAKGREVIFVEGWNGNKLMAHEAGMLNVMRASLDPDGMVAMLGNRYPISEIGISNLLRKLIEKGERDRQLGDCEVLLQPNHRVGERTCNLIQVTHPVKKPGYDFHVAQIFFDPEQHLPLRYACFSWPEKEGGQPILEEEYTYLDLKLNPGLSPSDFDPDNREYSFPK